MASGWYGRGGGGFWRPYVPMWKRRAQATRKASALAKKGHEVEPVEIEGRTIAHTFWGQSWCENLERYSDFENRLPRGRTYVRNGSVIDLQIEAGRVKALVSGQEIYTVSVKFAALGKKRWQDIKAACAGKIDSVIELLQGKLSRGVMDVLTARERGLFPSPKEIEMDCSCPDWADMCKHVAAVLYGVGARLDSRPDVLFLLRGVDKAELVKKAVAGAARLGGDAGGAMDTGEMEKLFEIEIDAGAGMSGGLQRGRRGGEPRSPARARAAVAEGAGTSPRTRLPRRDRAAAAAENGGLDARIARLRKHFDGAESLTNSDYRRLFSVEGAVATRELGELAARGVLVRTGAKRGTRYLAGAGLGAS